LIRIDRSVLQENERRGEKEWASCSALRIYFIGGEVRIFAFYNNKQTNKQTSIIIMEKKGKHKEAEILKKKPEDKWPFIFQFLFNSRPLPENRYVC